LKKKVMGFFGVVVFICIAILSVNVLAQPGGQNDPLVSQSFVESRIAELEARIAVLEAGGVGHLPPALPPTQQHGITQAERDALFAEFLNHFDAIYGNFLRSLFGGAVPHPTDISQDEASLSVINVSAGNSIIFEEGSEFILRTGVARVFAGPNGIVDLTAGVDVGNGQNVQHNHFMLVPASDGRGVTFSTSAWIIIRGNYHLIQ